MMLQSHLADSVETNGRDLEPRRPLFYSTLSSSPCLVFNLFQVVSFGQWPLGLRLHSREKLLYYILMKLSKWYVPRKKSIV